MGITSESGSSAECPGRGRPGPPPGPATGSESECRGAGPGGQSPARAVPATVGGHPAGDHDFLVDSAKSNLNFKLYSESARDSDSEIDSDHQQSGECIRMQNMQNLNRALFCILQMALHIFISILFCMLWSCNLTGM